MTVKVVYKYEFQATGCQSITMPQGAQILCVANRYENLCLWALVDKTNVPEFRSFVILGTGHTTDDERLDYIGTALFQGGQLVWHVFEFKPEATP